MRKISNPGLIRRNRQIGNIGQIGGLIILLGSFVGTFLFPTRVDIAFLLLILGFVMVNVGGSFTSRWGRTPPPDQLVDNLLKGLDDRYTIVHFRLGADHALFSPDGILVILSKQERGFIHYDGKKWRQTGVSALQKFFSAEGLGNPLLDARMEAESLGRKLRKILHLEEAPVVRPIVVFSNDKTRIEATNTSIPVLPASKVKESIRRMPKTPALRPDQLQQVIEYLGEKS
jgi:hypothetical protein